jgi:hypothetical protein
MTRLRAAILIMAVITIVLDLLSIVLNRRVRLGDPAIIILAVLWIIRIWSDRKKQESRPATTT